MDAMSSSKSINKQNSLGIAGAAGPRINRPDHRRKAGAFPDRQLKLTIGKKSRGWDGTTNPARLYSIIEDVASQVRHRWAPKNSDTFFSACSAPQ